MVPPLSRRRITALGQHRSSRRPPNGCHGHHPLANGAGLNNPPEESSPSTGAYGTSATSQGTEMTQGEAGSSQRTTKRPDAHYPQGQPTAWVAPESAPPTAAPQSHQARISPDSVWSSPPTSAPHAITSHSERPWQWAASGLSALFFLFVVMPAILRLQALPVTVVPASSDDLPYHPSGSEFSATWWLSLAIFLLAIKLVAGRWKGEGTHQSDLGLLILGYTGLFFTVIGVILAADNRKYPSFMDPVECITQDCWPEPQQSWVRAIPIIVTFIIMIIVGHMGNRLLVIQRVVLLQVVMMALSFSMILTWNTIWYPSFARNLPESTWGIDSTDFTCQTRQPLSAADITLTLPDGTESYPVISLPDTRLTASGNGTEVTVNEDEVAEAVTSYPRVIASAYEAAYDDQAQAGLTWEYTPYEPSPAGVGTLPAERMTELTQALTAANSSLAEVHAVTDVSAHSTTITLRLGADATNAAKQAGLSGNPTTLTIHTPDVTVVDTRIGPLGDGQHLAYGLLLSNGCQTDPLMFLMISEHRAVGTTIESGYALQGSIDPTAAGIAVLDNDSAPVIYTMTHTDTPEFTDVRMGACLTDLSLNTRWTSRWEEREGYSEDPHLPGDENIILGSGGWIGISELANPQHIYLNTCELVSEP